MLEISSKARERAIIVGIAHGDQNRAMVNEYLDELELLADTAGAEVLERVVQDRHRLDPSYMLGRGKAEELAQMAKYLDADLIVFDDDLTPAQAKNLEILCKIKVIDRSGLILDIFAKNARTREARTQVELAQLNYLLPRLTRQWTHLSRQIGGIGVRGPGETQLEVDRRLIRNRIRVLGRELEKIGKQRSNRRKSRSDLFKAALVGYTNVGKSTILNALTNADVLVEDQLFATLDSTIRSLLLDDHQRILLIDTVGFIRKLPHHLIASFKSTLEEAADADLLLHVIDVSHSAFRDQIATVKTVLHELAIDDRPLLHVFNKIDLLEDRSFLADLERSFEPCVFISAAQGVFLGDLVRKVCELMNQQEDIYSIKFPLSASKVIAKLYQVAKILNIEYSDDGVVVELKSDRQNSGRVLRLTEEAQGVRL
ncbi:MAG: GTPase HflX [Calditrichaeota bacterium]|nr:MAG: GTPase HflX [Calditrichota bacterium]